MALTQAEAEAQWRQDNPPPLMIQDGEEVRETTPAEYETMAADGAQRLLDQSEAEEAHDADVAEGKGILDKVKALEATAVRLKDPTITFTTQQIRNVVAEHMLVTAESVRYIHKHSGLPQEDPNGPA